MKANWKANQKYLTYQNLSYRPREWPPGTLTQCIPYVGHIFAHESASHLAFNSLSFYFLTSFLFPSMGVLTAATTFIAGGAMASQVDCATANAYANARNPWHDIASHLHASPRDPNPNGTVGASRLGSVGLALDGLEFDRKGRLRSEDVSWYMENHSRTVVLSVSSLYTPQSIAPGRCSSPNAILHISKAKVMIS